MTMPASRESAQMDAVSHVVFGRMLVALDARRRLGRGAAAACVIGSLAPDADVVLIPFGWDRYLLRHQAGTHSVLGSVVCAAALAGALRPAVRGSRYLPLLLAGVAGSLGHLLLDLGSGADIRPFWPVIQRGFTFPLFAMADPWLLGFFMVSFLVVSSGGHHPGRAAVLMTILAAFASVKAVLYEHAREVEARAVPPAAFRRGESVWGSLGRWSIYETRADVVEAWRVDAMSEDIWLMRRVPRNLNDAFVERSRAFETVQNFLAAHDVTFAVVPAPDTAGPAARTVVAWSDLRYCDSAATATIMPSGAPSGASARASRGVNWGALRGPARGLGRASGLSCRLWFGGEFDPAGRPETAIVDIGRLQQRRPVIR
jgi:membrane-bound metal-dependent hydrolase YbcI (DUF457 family)